MPIRNFVVQGNKLITSLEYDVNKWLEAHPKFEVRQITTALVRKTKEDPKDEIQAMLTVWYEVKKTSPKSN